MVCYHNIEISNEELQILLSLEQKYGVFEVCESIPKNTNCFLSIIIKNQHIREIGIGCHIFGEFPMEICKFEYLTNLNLSDNKIEKYPDSFQNRKSIKQIDLSNNSLDSFPNFLQSLFNLEILKLDWNDIHEIPDWIENLKELCCLKLLGNPIKKISVNIGKLSKLEALIMNPGFPFKPLEIDLALSIPESLENLINLRYLMIKGFPQINSDFGWLGSLINLKNCDLSQNSLRSIPNSLVKLDNLETLSLESNKDIQWSDIDVINKNLKMINISNCGIIDFPNFLILNKNLEFIDISENDINRLPENLDSLINLNNLNLKNNDFEEFPLVLCRLKRLKSLDISHNKIKVIPDDFFALPWLESCNFEHNLIQQISSFEKKGNLIVKWEHQGPDISTRYKRILDEKKIFNQDYMKKTLLQASLFIISWDLLNSTIIERVQNAYIGGYIPKDSPDVKPPTNHILRIEKMGMICDLRIEYLTAVTNDQEKIYSKSLDWLINREIITEADKKEINEIRGHRGKIAHVLSNILTDCNEFIRTELIERVRYFIRKINWSSYLIDLESQDFDTSLLKFGDYRDGKELLIDLIQKIINEQK